MGDGISFVVDGSFVPAILGKLILQGSYNPNPKLIVGHNANKTAYFVDPSAVTLSNEIANIYSKLLDA
jgi:hypothetical protein